MSLVFKVRRHVPGRGNARGNARASGASNNRSHYDWQTVRERVASGNCVFSSVSRDLFFFSFSSSSSRSVRIIFLSSYDVTEATLCIFSLGF